MKAVIYKEFNGPLAVKEVKDPCASKNGVVIQVKATGLCLSDWHGYVGHDPDILLPHVPGHEFAGLIVSIGSGVTKWKVGDRVTVPFVGGCGKCNYCKTGNQQVCDDQFQPGFTAWGSFAEYVFIANADLNLVGLPKAMLFEEAAALGCRFITAYRGVRQQGNLMENQSIGIYGCGGVGLSAILIAKAMGAKVIAIDINDNKCALAKSLGADYVINAKKANPVREIIEYSDGGVDISLDALGSTQTCLDSIHSLKKRGKHIQIGLMSGVDASPSLPMNTVIAKELEILGSHGMQAHAYNEMFQFIEKNNIDLSALISDTINLNEIPTRLPNLFSNPSLGITIANSF
ncbi:zinc-dependent alcohol dehydrogenase family protein [Eudoraea chungangensis]|uniref:zinc-dependent alcohol dehydrogenase family protein n=1 Tax=Eudoraea chungangensis TaxID=1481905 RepID=UPI0023EC7B94|nr:zinc-dependent alcohol dehydrogenase family protein [Eudoraea chungangensis]